MKGLLGRLFGGGPGAETTDARPAVGARLEVEPFSHGLVRIRALDFFGPHAVSPNGAFHLIWLDRNPEGTMGGHRYEGHGSWSLLAADGRLLSSGRLERPQDGHVADNGNFILSDWLFGDGLNGRLTGFGPDGLKLIERNFSANLASSALSDDGRIAICQTANAPGSADSCRYFLFDLAAGTELASWPQETGWADGYAFDTPQRRVFLVRNDGERVGYGFDGLMIEREAWQASRIAAGDLDVIRSVRDSAGEELPGEQRAALLAGLEVAAASGEAWQNARALRLRGEIFEQSGDTDAAIESYDRALTLDPQVGVSRRLAKLRQSSLPKGGKIRPAKLSRFEEQARRFGIGHEIVELERGSGKEWRCGPDTAMGPVEVAALDYYRELGWTGAASEGGLILTLIKAASFAALPHRFGDIFVEAIYAQNVAFPEDRFEHGQLLASVERAALPQIERNWDIIAATAGNTPAFYPAVQREHVLGLFEHLGAERLHAIAERFAAASYELRAGWPDLTLWRDGEVRFVEVKGPGDSMHASQARLISSLLVPLGFQVTLTEVRAK